MNLIYVYYVPGTMMGTEYIMVKLFFKFTIKWRRQGIKNFIITGMALLD